MPIVMAFLKNVADKNEMMKRTILIVITLLLYTMGMAENRIYNPQVKSLQAVVNKDWLSPTVMRLKGDDKLHVAFDELSYDYHRYIYQIEHCEADWSVSEDLFESNWLEGFNAIVIDDFERSINTTIPYTHYRFTIPNDRCKLKLSGNYRLHIIDEDTQDEVASVEFMITEQSMPITMAVSSNTDIDTNVSHQQVSFAVSYGDYHITNPEEQIITVVMQNGREDTWRWYEKPSIISDRSLRWEHRKGLIFDGGNEYRKFEILDPSHPTMGIERIVWNGEAYYAYPFVSEPRPNYLYDEDANGSFYIRNSDNRDNDTASDYIWVTYRLKIHELKEGKVVIDGHWTTENPETYVMVYDAKNEYYTASILQKQGYYSYQYLWISPDGKSHPLPSEGNYYETENRYQSLVYYKEAGERTWRLTSWGQITFR